MDQIDMSAAGSRLAALAKQANAALPKRTADRYREVPESMHEWFEEPAPTFDLSTADDGKPGPASNEPYYNPDRPAADLPPRADVARDDITGTGDGAEI